MNYVRVTILFKFLVVLKTMKGIIFDLGKLSTDNIPIIVIYFSNKTSLSGSDDK
jgi:hypothetical protein